MLQFTSFLVDKFSDTKSYPNQYFMVPLLQQYCLISPCPAFFPSSFYQNFRQKKFSTLPKLWRLKPINFSNTSEMWQEWPKGLRQGCTRALAVFHTSLEIEPPYQVRLVIKGNFFYFQGIINCIRPRQLSNSLEGQSTHRFREYYHQSEKLCKTLGSGHKFDFGGIQGDWTAVNSLPRDSFVI